VALTRAQLSILLEGNDRRRPERTWDPQLSVERNEVLLHTFLCAEEMATPRFMRYCAHVCRDASGSESAAPAKLRRMQFGSKSEKLAQKIEQLELRLEELQSSSAKNASPPEDKPAAEASSIVILSAKPARRARPDHLPRQTQRHEPKQLNPFQNQIELPVEVKSTVFRLGVSDCP
jgi:ATP-dependent exoDNAse (exonuclease V) beta subunit